MRLFNFVIEATQVTNASGETISATLSSEGLKSPGSVAASMTLRDNEAGSGAAHGGYSTYQTAAPTEAGSNLTLAANLSALPDATAHAGADDDSIIDVISVGQKNFEG